MELLIDGTQDRLAELRATRLEREATQEACDHRFRFVGLSTTPFCRAAGETRRKQISQCRKCGLTRAN
jgi:hypothetical protein